MKKFKLQSSGDKNDHKRLFHIHNNNNDKQWQIHVYVNHVFATNDLEMTVAHTTIKKSNIPHKGTVHNGKCFEGTFGVNDTCNNGIVLTPQMTISHTDNSSDQ